MAPMARQHQQERHLFAKVYIKFELSKPEREMRQPLDFRMASISIQQMTPLLTR
jgi:hypothetical protein